MTVGQSLIDGYMFSRVIFDLINFTDERQHDQYSGHDQKQQDQSENEDMFSLFLFFSDALILGGTVSIAFHNDALPFCLSLNMRFC